MEVSSPGPAHAVPDQAEGGRSVPDTEINRLRSLLQDGVDALPSGFALFDADDRCVIMNARFRSMLPGGAALLEAGACFAQMARHNALSVFGVPEAELDDWLARRIAYRESPENDTFDQKLTDGCWYRIQEQRTREGGTVTNWTDITDLKAEQARATDYAEALSRSNAALKDFAQAASHDLKEPLRKIETFAGRIEKGYAQVLDEKGLTYLSRMTDAATRMRRLITDLLDYSSIEAEAVAHGPVDLNDVWADVAGTLDMAMREAQARVTACPLPVVRGDAGQLARLFQNLLSNALKYSDPARRPEVTLSVTVESGLATLCLADNGIGFEPEQAETIFGIFTRLHGRRKYEGTGVGLASCRRIVERHGGTIRAEGEPGAGSRFFVTLPTV